MADLHQTLLNIKSKRTASDEVEIFSCILFSAAQLPHENHEVVYLPCRKVVTGSDGTKTVTPAFESCESKASENRRRKTDAILNGVPLRQASRIPSVQSYIFTRDIRALHISNKKASYEFTKHQSKSCHPTRRTSTRPER